jgi:predicted O-linked N-acetylglucosamine transferase (SPINDLY family)
MASIETADALRARLETALSLQDLVSAEQHALAITQIEPEHAQTWRDLALIRVHLGNTEHAKSALSRALQIIDQQPSLTRTRAQYRAEFAALLELTGELKKAQALLHEAIQLEPGELSHRTKLAAILLTLGLADEAAMFARQVVSKLPDSFAAWFVLADCAMMQKDYQAALRSYQRALALSPTQDSSLKAKLHYNIGICTQSLKDPGSALKAFDEALRFDPKLYAALSQRMFAARRIGDWRNIDQHAERLLALVNLGVPGPTPFSFLAEFSSAQTQLKCARTEAKRVLRELRLQDPLPTPAVHARNAETPLRIGFVSNGFGQHPTGLLVAELFEHLDKNQLAVTLFATAPSDKGPIRERLQNAVHEVVELIDLPSHMCEKMIRKRCIDVLVDLRGYGAGGVPEVFALRPASVQVNWLAYPGTSGAPWIDYCLADRAVMSTSLRPHFSEAIVYLSGSFQPFDSQSKIAPTSTRAQHQLPEHAFVFASFNNSYKINPQVADTWMQILARVPESVLWLLENADSQGFAECLHAFATRYQIGAHRIIFFKKSPHDEYLAALKHADLFLDTFPYGAHTTARDAQFVGCPLLTIAGDTFAARVGSSLNEWAKMPLLNCSSISHYIESAVALSQDRALLHSFGEQLLSRHARLFDSAAFARKFTHAIQAIDAHARNGGSPQDFDFSMLKFDAPLAPVGAGRQKEGADA